MIFHSICKQGDFTNRTFSIGKRKNSAKNSYWNVKTKSDRELPSRVSPFKPAPFREGEHLFWTWGLFSVSSSSTKDGKASRLHYRILKKAPDGSCDLEIELETGRFHQIRYQLNRRGLPLCGEARYANQGLPDYRLALWAFHLEFDYPVGKEKGRMVFDRMPTEDWWKQRLQK